MIDHRRHKRAEKESIELEATHLRPKPKGVSLILDTSPSLCADGRAAQHKQRYDYMPRAQPLTPALAFKQRSEGERTREANEEVRRGRNNRRTIMRDI